jgi:protein-tyrosine phosphatase
MLDIHCHILPGVDDGATDWAAALEMCRIAEQDGITHIVATPHANAQYSYDRAKHQVVLEELRSKFANLRFSLGCEFHLSYENVEAALKDPHHYTIGGSRFLLVEMSDYRTPTQLKELLFRLHCRGLATIIAHPERSPILAQYRELAAELVGMGCLLQITGDSLWGAWGRTARKQSEAYLEAGLVSVISSDAHDAHRRPPTLSKARKAAAKIVEDINAARLVDEIPDFIINQNPFSRSPESDGTNKALFQLMEAPELMGAHKLNDAIQAQDLPVGESDPVARA